MKVHIAAVIIAALMRLSASPLLAADADTLATSVGLGEVSVVGIKAPGRGGDRAQASTTLGAKEIERLGIVSMKQVSDIAPNFYMPAYGSRMTASIYMRGLGARIDQPAVGLNIDNVAVLNKDAYDFELPDIESITVTRGPQSTMHGRNTMAGLIAITTLSPMRRQGFRAMAEAGTHRNCRVAATWLAKTSATTATSLSAGAAYAGGYFTNAHSGARADRERSLYGRWRAVWQPRRNVTVDNVAWVTAGHQNGYPYASAETGVIAYNDTCFYRRTALIDGLTVAWQPSERLTLTAVTSVQHIDDNMTLDQDFTTRSYFTLTQRRHETAVTQDVTLRGTCGRYSWLAGAYGFIKRGVMAAPVTFKDTGIAELIVKHRNEYNPGYPVVWDDDSFTLHSDFVIPVKGASAYHRSEVTLGRWTLSASLRLDYERSELRYNSRCATSYTTWDHHTDPANPMPSLRHPVEIDNAGRLSRDFVQLLPRIEATMRLDSRSSLYASVAKGYKSGGYNTQMFSDVLQQELMSLMGLTPGYDTDEIVSYRPEKSWNYEIGAHIEGSDGRVSVDAAAFLIDCRDQQLTMFPDGTTTGRIMANAGRTRSAGVEISAGVRPTRHWLINASWGLTDARFVKFNNGINDFSGNRIPYAPANTLYIGATRIVPFPSGCAARSLTLTANVRGTGSIVWDEEGADRQPFYALAGASAIVDFGRLTVDISGENLTNCRYNVFQYKSIGNTFHQRGRPLTAAVTLRLTIE